MIITVNGQKKEYKNAPDLTDVLEQEGVKHQKVAVALNGGFLPRTAYEGTTLSDGDEVEIVAPAQGG